MATDKSPEHKALKPLFDVVMKGLKGLVDGEHYYDTISDDAQFEFLYRFPGWPEVIRGRENLVAAYAGYGNSMALEKGDGLEVHHDKEQGVVTLEYQVHGKAVKTGTATPSLCSWLWRLDLNRRGRTLAFVCVSKCGPDQFRKVCIMKLSHFRGSLHGGKKHGAN